VYEDDDLIVVNKAAGMVVHPAYGNRTGTLVNALLHHTGSGVVSRSSTDTVGLSTRTALPVKPGDIAVRPGIVHRLDKDTSGLIVVAKKDTVHVNLAQQFFHRTIGRRYEAVVWGHPQPESGQIETSLARDPRDRKRMAVVGADAGKTATTLYETMEVYHDLTLVQFKLLTGRTHQIRVHAAHIGHPIFGDPTYGGRAIRLTDPSKGRRLLYKELLGGFHRQALHAATLEFTHPSSEKRLSFVAAPPADMQLVLDTLRESKPSR
jgi:23S rRNA pseudouridine1911/1915/1917 synthase